MHSGILGPYSKEKRVPLKAPWIFLHRQRKRVEIEGVVVGVHGSPASGGNAQHPEDNMT